MKTHIHFILFLYYLVSKYPTRSSLVSCLANNCETCETGQSFSCATCVAGYYVDSSSKNCNKCPQGCSTCTSSIGPCSSCSIGYFLNSGTCGTCPNNCAYCQNQYACKTCNDFFILKTLTSTTTNCIKPDCTAEATKKYILINDLSCTDCTGVDESFFDKQYCQKKINAPFLEIIQNTDEILNLNVRCETANKLYLIGGVGGYPFVSFEKIQDRVNYQSSSREVLLKNSGLIYIFTLASGITYTLSSRFKITGEKYVILGYCEYLGIKSSSMFVSYKWYNNTMLESLIIKMKSTASLSLDNKKIVAFAIQSVLKTENDVWVNEDEPEESASSFIYIFYILPYYLTNIQAPDAEITNLKRSILNDPAKFIVDVGNRAFLNEVSFTEVSALSFVTTDAIPYLEEEYPIINVKANTFQMNLKQIEANGTLYWAYRISTPDDLKIGRSTMAEEDYETISFDGIAAKSGLKKQKVSKDQVINASVTGLNYNTKYTIFYYGTNNGMPKIKTLIYTNIIQTDPASCPNNCAQCDLLTGKCQSCSQFYSLNSLENVCILDCSKDSIKKYQLITDLSCTDCKSPGYSIYNATHCHNLLVPKITITVSNDGVTTLDLVCNSGSTFYWAYGLVQSASLPLAQVQSLIKNPATDPLYYRTVGFDGKYKGSYQSSTVNLNTILSNMKNSGEDYTLVAFCEYLGASTTATTTFKSFKNPKLEVLLINLAAATPWTSSQKSAVAGAIGFVLGTKKYVWTDENKYVAGSTRILETSNTAQFYIYPDYTINNGLDDEIYNLNKVMSQDPAKFLSAVNLKVAQSGLNLIQVTANTYIASSSAPNLITAYPNIVVDANSFEMILRQGGADGTLNWAYKAKSSWAKSASSIIPDAEFTTYSGINLNHTTAVMDKDIKINVTGLISNTSYDVYYYGQSYGVSNTKTPIYSQIITTLANSTFNSSKTNGISTSTMQRLLFSCFLFWIIIFI